METQLLVNSCEFWSTLQRDIRASKHSIYIQTLSFEGDSVGQMLSTELLSAHAHDIRLLIDCYTKYVMSDCFLYRPKNFFDPNLKMEKAQTLNIIAALNQAGTQVKFSNPVGLFWLKFPARNHKKQEFTGKVNHIPGLLHYFGLKVLMKIWVFLAKL